MLMHGSMIDKMAVALNLSSEQAALLLPLLQQLSSNNISSSSANIANAEAQHLSTSVDHDQREDQEESTQDPVTSITRPRLTCW